MATIIARPTTLLHYSQFESLLKGAIDNDPSASGNATAYGSGTTTGVYGGFNFSALPSTAIIKNITVFVKAYSSRSVSAFSNRLVKNATGTSNYTDLGDDSKVFVADATISSDNYYSITYPVAASSVTADFLRSGSLQSRLYFNTTGNIFNSTTLRLYDLYVAVEYELPNITVTTNASPPEGGTVTGGGSYESGSTVTATAIPNEGYIFSHWLINGADSGSSNPISGVLTADTTVTAVFEKISHPEISSVQITPNPCEAGQGFIISVGFSE